MLKKEHCEKLLENYIDSIYSLSQEIDSKLSYFLSFPSIYFIDYNDIRKETDTRVQIYKIIHYFKFGLLNLSEHILEESDFSISKFCSKYSINKNLKNIDHEKCKEMTKRNYDLILKNMLSQDINIIDMNFDEQKFNSILYDLKSLISAYENLCMSFTKKLNLNDYNFPFIIKNSIFLSIKKILRSFNFIFELKEYINHTIFLLEGNYISMYDFAEGNKNLFKFRKN